MSSNDFQEIISMQGPMEEKNLSFSRPTGKLRTYMSAKRTERNKYSADSLFPICTINFFYFTTVNFLSYRLRLQSTIFYIPETVFCLVIRQWRVKKFRH